ncbi:hypothetical protein J6590_010277 [Homalodisca vitripennis]|nr:hypothetical protein J6590_010277 [Homalodisca vitripennis]
MHTCVFASSVHAAGKLRALGLFFPSIHTTAVFRRLQSLCTSQAAWMVTDNVLHLRLLCMIIYTMTKSEPRARRGVAVVASFRAHAACKSLVSRVHAAAPLECALPN